MTSTPTPQLSTAGTPGPPPAVRPGMILAGSVLGFFIITLDALVVNVALPAMSDDVGGGMTALQWVVDGYTLMFAALMLSAGALADRIGAGRTYIGGLVFFTLASVACGLAPNMPVLIGARLVQGCAASVITPASLALIRQVFPDDAQRVRALSLWSAGGAVAAAAGPVAGGVLTSALGWRAIFFLNLPVGLLALWLMRRVPASPRRRTPVDLAGQGTAVVTLAALTFGMIEGGARGYGDPLVLASLALAAAALAVFVVVESRHAHPMLPLSLLRSRFVSVPSLVGATISVAFYGSVFVLGLYFQQERGLSALQAGLMFLPMTTVVAVLNLFVAARLIQRFGPRPPIVAGQAVTAVTLAVVALFGDRVGDAALAVLIVPVCCVGGVAVPAATALLMNNVPGDRTGTASGVMNTFRQVGTALAIAVFGALVAGDGSFFTGLRASLLAAAALLVVSLATVLAAVRGAAPAGR
ncbi:MFS transporter [Streptomyces sp. NPDC038707]|uniref:MFS transporter n=1 Tax=unclassified Streptomyces TaxID=2593676 RepID=UPI0033D8C20C